MIRIGPAASPPQIWAVEDTALQITWGNLPAGPVRAAAADRDVTVDHIGGPGGLVIDGLPSGRSLQVELSWDSGSTTLTATTLDPPPGELLSRFATISDLHLGAVRWGLLKTMTDTSGFERPYPFRCAQDAIAEAVAWGAEALVIKGDAAQHESDEDFAQVARLVDGFPDLPMLLVPGNHDVDARSGSIPLTVGARELPFTRTVDSIDLAGVRVMAADTTVTQRGHGTLERVGDAVLERMAASDRPVFLGLHHQLMTSRFPRYWPIGIDREQSNRFLDQVDRLRPPVAISSGHTHRNRSRRHGSTLLTEVGSTKDWPNVWAGYAVHEGGIRQVVRRIIGPESMHWSEYSREAVGGLWGLWSPGPLRERCLSHAWSAEPSLVARSSDRQS